MMAVQRGFIEICVSLEFDPGNCLAIVDAPGFAGVWNDGGVTRLYWREAQWDEQQLTLIKDELVRVGLDDPKRGVVVRPVPEEDWNQKWAESVAPIQIGPVRIRPSWHPSAVPTGGIELVLDPKRAFGTGHHATTHLMIECLDELIQGGEDILDVGAGSGILAMVAVRFGAQSALQVEPDPVALECAKVYAQENDFGDEIAFEQTTLAGMRTQRTFDVIVANLDRRTILDSCGEFLRFTRAPITTLLLSGILATDQAGIREVMTNAGWVYSSGRERDGWVALAFRALR